jgi:inner membrane protein
VLAAALAVVLIADEALHRLKVPWLVGGVIDETAHFATAVIVHANLPPAPPVSRAAFAVGAVAVDSDHVPLIPRRHKIKKDEPRPALHTLLTPAAIAVAATVSRARAREALLGLEAGTWAHFFRDVGTGTGLPVIQPLARWRLKLPRRCYELATALLAWRAWKLPRL